MFTWNISFLEAYWPFILHIYFVFILWLHLFYEKAYFRNKSAQALVPRCYQNAKFDYYHQNAEPTTASDDFEKTDNVDGNRRQFIFWTPIFIILIALVVLRHMTPQLIRQHGQYLELNNSTSLNYTNAPWQFWYVQFSYGFGGGICSLIFFGIICKGFYTYTKLAVEVDDIMASATNDERFIEYNSNCYYNLTRPINLDYFFARFKKAVANTDSNGYYLASITYAFIVDIIFILIALDRLFFINTTINVISILLLIDIIVLSLIVITF